jgi:ubiquinol-cytochrome c reductase cytochrome c1 subunit
MLRVNFAYYLILLLISLSACVSGALASSSALKPKQVIWPFEGVLGMVDRQAAQRGAQVYLEVCSACHGLNRVYYRNLRDLGFSDAEIKELAKNKNVIDGPNDAGEMFERPAIISDRFVSPYANEQAARAANNGAYPLDLSLIIKAREDGANYVYSLLTGYQEAPDNITLLPGLYYNPYFEGGQIGMPAPLSDNQVTYVDGTNANVEQMARDVVVFLQWAAEPEMEHRKSLGLKAMLYLSIFTIFFYIAQKVVWRNVK